MFGACVLVVWFSIACGWLFAIFDLAACDNSMVCNLDCLLLLVVVVA